MKPNDEPVMTASGDHVFHQHLEVCPQCRDNPMGLCDHGAVALRQAVDEGSTSEYNRTLDRHINGERDA